jgi:hypothetical protein
MVTIESVSSGSLDGSPDLKGGQEGANPSTWPPLAIWAPFDGGRRPRRRRELDAGRGGRDGDRHAKRLDPSSRRGRSKAAVDGEEAQGSSFPEPGRSSPSPHYGATTDEAEGSRAAKPPSEARALLTPRPRPLVRSSGEGDELPVISGALRQRWSGEGSPREAGEEKSGTARVITADMADREALHRLVDELSEADVALTERMLRALAAPLDDEPDDDDGDGGLTAAREELARGEGIPHDEILCRFGLKRAGASSGRITS